MKAKAKCDCHNHDFQVCDVCQRVDRANPPADKSLQQRMNESELKKLFPNASEAFLRANQSARTTAPVPPAHNSKPLTMERAAGTISTKKRMRQSSKPLLNKLETEWRDYLRRQYPGVEIHEQALRFRLANGLRYTPDLVLWVEGRMICWECKGPKAFRGGFENLKAAANRYQDAEWWLCWKDGGEWQTQKVLA